MRAAADGATAEDNTQCGVTPLKESEQLDLFGRRVPRVRQNAAMPWKMEYKLNNPEYDKVNVDAVLARSKAADSKELTVATHNLSLITGR